jgi:serine/threonine protein phosphatase PrpC
LGSKKGSDIFETGKSTPWCKTSYSKGLFSKSLVSNIKNFYEKQPEKGLKDILALSVLKTKEIGTSTATLVSLKNDTLKTANLGDSAYAIYSLNIEKSTEK